MDEIEHEHETKYLAEKNGLSGGWRGFSIAHKLQESDVLVFHLIQQRKFKVKVKQLWHQSTFSLPQVFVS